MQTPWGKADSIQEITRGAKFVGTPGHGGLLVAKGFAEKHFTSAARSKAEFYNNYYCFEEDCQIFVAIWELLKYCDSLDQSDVGELATACLIQTNLLTCGLKKAIDERTISLPEAIEKMKQDCLKSISSWNADYLIAVGITPLESEYAYYKERKLSEELRKTKNPNFIVSASSINGLPKATKVWTADGKQHLVTATSYVSKTLNYLSDCKPYVE